MGIHILEGTKVNDGPDAGTAAVLYCSTYLVALPMMFDNAEEAQRFLDWFGQDPRKDESTAWKEWERWVAAGKPEKGKPTRITKRPNLLDPPVIEAVVKKLLPQVTLWLEEDIDSIDPTTDLTKAIENAFAWDGYRIARALSDLGWEPDDSLVNTLSLSIHEAYLARDEITRQWVASEGIKPTYKVGDTVTYKGNICEVTKVDEQLARYLLFCEALGHVHCGLGTHGTYANFEDVSDGVESKA